MMMIMSNVRMEQKRPVSLLALPPSRGHENRGIFLFYPKWWRKFCFGRDDINVNQSSRQPLNRLLLLPTQLFARSNPPLEFLSIEIRREEGYSRLAAELRLDDVKLMEATTRQPSEREKLKIRTRSKTIRFRFAVGDVCPSVAFDLTVLLLREQDDCVLSTA
jgi:hypothetical protein